jgi:methionine-rich copper-binding protein CopC
MAGNHEDQGTLRRYLLGQLTDNEQQEIELRLMAEEELFEQLQIAEDEIIDEYIAARLTAAESDRFEQHFLATPERQKKLRFARSLNQYVTTMASQQRALGSSSSHLWDRKAWTLRLAAAAALAVLVGGALWLNRQRTAAPQTLVTLTLNISGNTRGESAPADRVKLPLQADALKISLKIPVQPIWAGRYRVELVNDNGETSPLEMASQDAQSVSVVIPAEQLERGQYALKLFAINTDGMEQRINGSYIFIVE